MLLMACTVVQVAFHSGPLIFICPDPILNHFYLISVFLHMFYRNTASKFLKFTYHMGYFLIMVASID